MKKKIVFSFITACVFFLMMAGPCMAKTNLTDVYIDGAPVNAGGMLTAGKIFYVNDTGGSDSYPGTSIDMPCDTIDGAIGKCTASKGDIIVVCQGHTENLSAADAIDADVAGITIIGLGNGANRPTLTFTGTAGEFVIGAANITVQNIRFVAGIAGITMGISIEAGGDNFTMKDCEFTESVSRYGFTDVFDLASGADYVTIDSCQHYAIDTNSPVAHVVEAGNGVNKDLTIKNCVFEGYYSVSAIWSDTADLRVLIQDNTITNYTTGQHCVEFTSTAKGFIRDNAFYTDTYATTLDPGSLNCSGNTVTTAIDKAAKVIPAPDPTDSSTDYTSEVGDNTVLAYIMTNDGNVSDYDDGTDSLEAISDALAAGTGCTVAIDADGLDHLVTTGDGTAAYPASVANDSILALLMSDDDPAAVASYNNTTDSLEAISNALSAGTGATAAIDADHLDHLMNTDGTAQVYPEQAQADSTICKILSDDDPADCSSYNNATDSLEAISNALSAGTGCTTAIEADALDHLAAAGDGTAAYPASVANDSIIALMMSDDDPAAVSSYDNTTDSLEAISNALAAGTGVTTALDADFLDHLVNVDGATQVYPENAAEDSIIAKILSDDDPANCSSYNNATDSLEAISNALSAGTGCTTAIEADALDHLAAAADGTDPYPASVANDSIIAMLMSDDDPAAVSSYDNTTDSLEAISNALAAGTGCTTAIDADHLDHLVNLDGATQVYPEQAVEDSIICKILSDDDPANCSSYDNSTDSLEAISNALAAGTGATTAIEADDLDHLFDLDGATQVYPENAAEDSTIAKILSDDDPANCSSYNNATDSLEAIGTKTEFITHVATCTTTAAAGTDNMFDVGGPILITSLFGICTEAAAGSPGDMSIEYDATTGADYDSDFSTSVTVDTLGLGDTIHFSNAIDEGVLTITANVSAGQPLSWIAGDPAGGVIEQTLTSTGTLGVTWYMTYIPLTASSTVSPSS